MKRVIVLELDIDETLYPQVGEELEWFESQVIRGDLILHSQEVGDSIGDAKFVRWETAIGKGGA